MKIEYMGVEMLVYITWEDGREVKDLAIYVGIQNCTELLEAQHQEIIDEYIKQEKEANCDVEAFL